MSRITPYRPYVEPLRDVAREAGQAIMRYYRHGAEIMIKEDHSPVTTADLAANDVIVNHLMRLSPQIPIISEESDPIEITTSRYWLVDPLDGTKSFIKKTGQFTVNIALIDHGVPCGGIIYAPCDDASYFTGQDGYAYKQVGQSLPYQIKTRAIPKEGAVVIASQTHRSKETDSYINTLPQVTGCITASSSIKFCLLAEAKADIYPRFGPTMAWDTAAGHAILQAAGGVVKKTDGSLFTYHSDQLPNPHFIAYGR